MAPGARSGLPPALERVLIRRFGRTARGRIKAAGVLRALGVLVRKHPLVAAEVAGAGMVQAGRVGLHELKVRLTPDRPQRSGRAKRRNRLSAAEERRFRKLLDDGRAGRSDRASPAEKPV